MAWGRGLAAAPWGRAAPRMRQPGSCQKAGTLTESQAVSPLPWPYGRGHSSQPESAIRYRAWMYAQDNSTSEQVALSVSSLCKTYSEVVAVEQVSFEVHRREVVGLLGPNGAGKTTTINMILGVLSPTAGSVQIGGIDLTRQRARALAHANFSAVYAPLPGNLTVAQNLRFFGLVYR